MMEFADVVLNAAPSRASSKASFMPLEKWAFLASILYKAPQASEQ